MQRKKRKATTDAVEILHRRYYRGKPVRLAALERARADDHVARKIAALRTEAGLSQRQLAKLIGTTASVICRLENADYDGHSLAMLNRIATALNRRVEIHFVGFGGGRNNLSGTDRNLRSEFNVASFCGSTCRLTAKHTHPEVMQILYCEICLFVTFGRALVFNCYRVPNP